ncbi:MAG: hypothetical protein JWO20_381 [Candidatus Angelobacter sp.]|jgi:hypothetical protein|nr:hypothetical protein [Candidatus Angelobacter sp.]
MSSENRPIPNSIDAEIEARIWERKIPGRLLPRLFFRKVWNRYFDKNSKSLRLEPAVDFDGLVVFDFVDSRLFGGGTVHGPDFLRVLLELQLGSCDRICDFCCGVGYIGYSLLARRFCKTLCFIDLNGDAIDAANFNAKFNGLDDVVTSYVSDGLEQVPENEKWDLVVCNPPQLLPRVQTDCDTRFTFDPEWRLHRKFYSSLKKYMKPGGHAVLLGARYESNASTFEPMVKQGGGKIVAEVPARDFRGREDDRYFLVTEW